MPVFALYNFDDADTIARDSALGNGAQDGLYLNGAAAAGGQAVLDGENDLIKIYPNPAFQMDRGTLDINFSLGADPLTGTQTVLSRDSAGTTDGGYRIEIQADGAVIISHETPTGVETFGTAPGFAHPGDSISLSYSWDQGGAGGVLNIDNATTGGSFTDSVPNTLTMDMSGQGINQPWIIGAGQTQSDPNMLNNIDQHFQGSVTMFQLSDTVDNVDDRDGVVRGTDAGEVIDGAYVDPFDADRVDANDAILPGDVGNDDVILAGAGNDTVYAADGDDSVSGGVNADQLYGGVGNDTLQGDTANTVDPRFPSTIGSLADSLYGGEGNDSLIGSSDADRLYGGAGNDTLTGGGTNWLYNSANLDVIDGGEGDDQITSSGIANLVTGGTGADTIVAIEGAVYGDERPPVGGTSASDLPDQAYPGLYTADADTTNNSDTITMRGSSFNLAFGGDDNDTINGSDFGADTIDGGVDDDSIFGNSGNDSLYGNEGDDTIDGGAGNDTIFGDSSRLEGGNPSPELADDAGDLVPNNNRDLLNGGLGDDLIFGGDDDDTLNGDVGNDDLRGGLDDDLVNGGAGNDGLMGETGNDVLNGDAGNDTLYGGAGNDSMTGGADRDLFVGGNAGDVVDGSETGDDNDTLDLRGLGPLTIVYDAANPENGTVTFRDADGNPTGTMSFVNIENVLTDPSDGPDANPDTAETDEDEPVTIPVLANDTDPEGQPLTVTEATAPNGTVTVNPNGTLTYTPNADFNGEDTITYTVTDPDGNEDTATVTVTVNPVNDAPVAGDDTSTTPLNTPITFAVMGNDTDVDGDTLSILGTPTSADGTVTVNGDGTLTFTPNAGFTGDAVVNYTVTDPEGLTDSATWTITVGTGPGRDGIVRGTDGADLINGTYVDPFDADRVDAGDAILPGDAPNDDRILAGAGNDTVLAGLGDDSVEGGTGDDSVRGGAGDDTLFGQAGDDTLVGEDGDDVIHGGLGNDEVRGGAGNDVIDTSGGATPLPDQDYPGLYAADGNPNDDRDLVYGGEGDDTIRTGDDADTIEGGFGNDEIEAGFDDDLVDGNQGNDTIIGGEGNDTVDGGQGDDLIYGGYGPGVPDAVNIPDSSDLRPNNGRDDLYGGLGNDTIYGMDDDDTIHGGQGDDLVNAGIDDDLVYGEAGNDILNGDDGNDTMAGGLGNDILNGGAGADLLSGNADRDTFVVGSQANGNGDTVHGGAAGDDFDRLDLSGAGPYRLTGVTEDSDGNGIDGTVEFLDADGNVTGSMVFTNIEEIIPCFTPGTLIATAKGEVAVEHLKAGDRVITRDNGIQEIRWVGQKTLGWKDLAANPHLKPVLIRQGSLGNGLPERDMMVSPNHRMLVANDRTALYFDEHEVLVSAKHLVAANGIQSIDSIGTTYLHFMFDRHEVVLGNGAWTESFQPGDLTLKGMGNAQRNEIFELFPELKTEAGVNDYQAARRTLKRHEASLLVK